MSQPGMYELGSKVLRLSQARKLAWGQNLRYNEYRVDFPDVSLEISHFGPPVDAYQLNLVGETGGVTDSLVVTLGETDPKQDPGLREIYELAEAYVRDGTLKRAFQYLERV